MENNQLLTNIPAIILENSPIEKHSTLFVNFKLEIKILFDII
jgi:hypothetical protein